MIKTDYISNSRTLKINIYCLFFNMIKLHYAQVFMTLMNGIINDNIIVNNNDYNVIYDKKIYCPIFPSYGLTFELCEF